MHPFATVFDYMNQMGKHNFNQRIRFCFLILFILIVVSCNNSPQFSDVSDKTVVTFAVPDWTLYRLAPTWEDLIDEFEAEHPDIKIELILYSEILDQPADSLTPTETFWQDMAENADAMWSFLQEGIPIEPVESGLIMDLTPFIDQNTHFDSEDFYPGALESISWNGGVWALPLGIDYEVLYYDQAAVVDANIIPPQPSWSWDDFRATARALTSVNDTGNVWGFSQKYANTLQLLEIRGATLIDKNISPPKLMLEEPQLVDAANWWITLAQQDRSMPAFARNYFEYIPQTDRAVMWPDSLAHFQFIEDQSVGVVNFPGQSPIHLEQVAISAGTKHPEAAWEWLSFLTHQVGYEQYLPARRSVAESSGYWDQLDEKQREILEYSLENSSRLTYQNIDTDIYHIIVNALRNTEAEHQSVEEALHLVQGEANNLWQANLAEYHKIAEERVVVVDSNVSVGVDSQINQILFLVPDPNDLAVYRQLAEEYQKENPTQGVVVDLIGSESSFQSFAEQSDCFVAQPSLNDPTSRGAVLPLEALLKNDTHIDDALFLQSVASLFEYEGLLLGLPRDFLTYHFVGNEDVLTASSINYLSEDLEAQEFVGNLQELTASSSNFAFVGVTSHIDLPIWVEMLGGELLTAGDGIPRAQFVTTETSKALEVLTMLAQTNVIALNSNGVEVQRMIDEGKIGLWASTESLSTENDLVFIPLPYSQVGPHLPVVYASGYFISAQTQLKQECWDWIAYLTANTSYWGIGNPAKVADFEALLQTQLGDQSSEQLFAQVQQSIQPAEYWRFVSEPWLFPYISLLNTAYIAVIEGDRSLANALQDAQESADRYYECLNQFDSSEWLYEFQNCSDADS